MKANQITRENETMNATIYDYETAEYITQGLQSTLVCDEAIQAAKRIAADRGEPVILEDDGDGSKTKVYPDGTTEDASDWCE